MDNFWQIDCKQKRTDFYLQNSFHRSLIVGIKNGELQVRLNYCD